jgi:DNA-binding LytR/AlgR family response regulator
MNAAPRAVIADDERLMREQMRARLTEVWPELEIVAEAKNGLEAVQAVQQHAPDIVFLDIRMPGLTGVEAARQIAQLELDDDALLPEIVFVTAYDQYAIEAFEQGVADYVLKPAERERLALTAERLKKRLATRGTADAPAAAPIQLLLHKLSRQLDPTAAQVGYLKWIQASVGSTIQMIPVADVLFFISDEKYTRVQTAQVEALIRKPIKELVDELDPQLFWQIHRSTLVNVNAVSGVARDFRGRQIVSVKGHPEKLEVSRVRRKAAGRRGAPSRLSPREGQRPKGALESVRATTRCTTGQPSRWRGSTASPPAAAARTCWWPAARPTA